jgi:hypothetical protein
MSEIVDLELTLYAVRNSEGKFFRSKGYGGYGESWVDKITSAKLYGKIGPARSCVTFWSRQYEKYGVPDIVELRVTSGQILIEERDRAITAVNKLRKAKEESKVNQRKQELKRAEQNLNKAKQELAAAQSKFNPASNLSQFHAAVVELAFHYPDLLDCVLWAPKSTKLGIHIFCPNNWRPNMLIIDELNKLQEQFGLDYYIRDINEKPVMYARSDGAPFEIRYFAKETLKTTNE